MEQNGPVNHYLDDIRNLSLLSLHADRFSWLRKGKSELVKVIFQHPCYIQVAL